MILATRFNFIIFDHQSNLILNIITEFTTDYRNILDGNANDLASDELSGGARISFVFHEIYGTAIRGMDPFDQIKDTDIRTILYNSSGSHPALFVGTAAFEVLVKQQIKRLEDPSLKCCAMVYDELVRILNKILLKPVRFYFLSKNPLDFQTIPCFARQNLSSCDQLLQKMYDSYKQTCFGSYKVIGIFGF